MKKMIIVPTVLVGMIGGYIFSQSDIITSAEKAATITAQQAKEIALKQYGGNIIDFEYDRDDNVPHYEIDIKNGNEKIELYIDATTGKVTVKERETLSSDKAPTISAQQAKEIALKQYGGNIIDFEYDHDDNTPHYEIDIKNGNEKIELYIDATTGKVTVKEREVYNKNSNVQVNQTAKILTEKEAIAIAQNKAKGTVTKVELDEDDDILVYEIEIENGNTEYDFEIHATTGKILKFETDRDDD